MQGLREKIQDRCAKVVVIGVGYVGLPLVVIPIDPLYLSWRMRSLKYQARFIELADTINSARPAEVVALVQEALNRHRKAPNGSKILIAGVAC